MPLRPPCVLMKYSNTVSPSRKLLLTGVSRMRPVGSLIGPRIPASCFTWLALPRALEVTIM